MLSFKNKIKNLRKEKDMTQEQVAEYIGVSPQAVSRWETGVTCPDIFLLPSLADLFGVTVDGLLGVNEKEKQEEIDNLLVATDEQIDCGMVDKAIVSLREALKKHPNNERLLCQLLYALYVVSEDEDLCRTYDSEIISIANRMIQFAKGSHSRNEATRILFRHYCDTNRKAQAMQIAKEMAPIETSFERNQYWALEGEERLACLKERMADDLHYLLWDMDAYVHCADISHSKKEWFNMASQNIKNILKEELNIQ